MKRLIVRKLNKDIKNATVEKILENSEIIGEISNVSSVNHDKITNILKELNVIKPKVEENAKKIEALKGALYFIGSASNNKQELLDSEGELANQFIQDNKEREPIYGDIILSSDNYLLIFTDVWTDFGKIKITTASTTEEGLIKLGQNEGEIIVEESIAKVKGWEELKASIEEKLEAKLDVLTFNSEKETFETKLRELETNKADKTELVEINSELDSLNLTLNEHNTKIEKNKTDIAKINKNITSITDEKIGDLDSSSVEGNTVIEKIDNIKNTTVDLKSNQTIDGMKTFKQPIETKGIYLNSDFLTQDYYILPKNAETINLKLSQNDRITNIDLEQKSKITGVKTPENDNDVVNKEYVDIVDRKTNEANRKAQEAASLATAVDVQHKSFVATDYAETKQKTNTTFITSETNKENINNIIENLNYVASKESVTQVNSRVDRHDEEITGIAARLINYTNRVEVNTEQIGYIYEILGTMHGSIVIVGKDEEHTKDQLLYNNGALATQFVQNTKRRAPKVGDMIISNDEYALSYNGENWMDLGLFGISLASTTEAGAVKLSTAHGCLIATGNDGTVKVSGWDELVEKVNKGFDQSGFEELEQTIDNLKIIIEKNKNDIITIQNDKADKISVEELKNKIGNLDTTLQGETVTDQLTDVANKIKELGSNEVDLTDVYEKISKIETTKLDKATYNIDKSNLEQNIQNVESNLNTNIEKVNTLEQTVNTNKNEFDTFKTNEFNTVKEKVENIDTDLTELTEKTDSNEERLNTLEPKVNTNEEQIENITSKLETLKRRLVLVGKHTLSTKDQLLAENGKLADQFVQTTLTRVKEIGDAIVSKDNYLIIYDNTSWTNYGLLFIDIAGRTSLGVIKLGTGEDELELVDNTGKVRVKGFAALKTLVNNKANTTTLEEAKRDLRTEITNVDNKIGTLTQTGFTGSNVTDLLKDVKVKINEVNSTSEINTLKEKVSTLETNKLDSEIYNSHISDEFNPLNEKVIQNENNIQETNNQVEINKNKINEINNNTVKISDSQKITGIKTFSNVAVFNEIELGYDVANPSAVRIISDDGTKTLTFNKYNKKLNIDLQEKSILTGIKEPINPTDAVRKQDLDEIKDNVENITTNNSELEEKITTVELKLNELETTTVPPIKIKADNADTLSKQNKEDISTINSTLITKADTETVNGINSQVNTNKDNIDGLGTKITSAEESIRQNTVSIENINNRLNTLTGRIVIIGRDETNNKEQLLADNGAKANAFVQEHKSRPAESGDVIISNDNHVIYFDEERWLDLGLIGVSIATSTNPGIIKLGSNDGEIEVIDDQGKAKVKGWDFLKGQIESKAEKTLLQSTKSELQSSITANTQKINQIETKVSNLETNKADKTSVIEVNNKIGELTTTGVTGETVSAQLKKLKTDIDGVPTSSKIEEIETNIENLKNNKLDKTVYNEDKNNITEEIQQIKTNLDSANNEITLNKDIFNTFKTEEFTPIKTKVETNETKINELNNTTVKLSGNQRINGVKTFTSPVIFNELELGFGLTSAYPVRIRPDDGTKTLAFNSGNKVFNIDLGLRSDLTGLKAAVNPTDAVRKQEFDVVSSNVNNLTETVSKHVNDYSTFKTNEFNPLKVKVSDIEPKIGDLESTGIEGSDIASQLTQVKTNLDSLATNENFESLQVRINSLETDKLNKNVYDSFINGDYNTTKTKANAADTLSKTNKTNIDQANAKITTNEESISTINNTLRNKVDVSVFNPVKEQSDSNKAKIEQAEQNINTHNTQIGEINSKLDALSGRVIFIGRDEEHTKDELLATNGALANQFVMDLKRRDPELGDLIISNDNYELYFDGTNWLNVGSKSIALASVETPGLIKLGNNDGELESLGEDGKVNVKGWSVLNSKVDSKADTTSLEEAKSLIQNNTNEISNIKSQYTKKDRTEKITGQWNFDSHWTQFKNLTLGVESGDFRVRISPTSERPVRGLYWGTNSDNHFDFEMENYVRIKNLPEATTDGEPVRKIDLDTSNNSINEINNKLGDISSVGITGDTVTDKLNTIYGNYVRLNDNQTITGRKTFTGNTTLGNVTVGYGQTGSFYLTSDDGTKTAKLVNGNKVINIDLGERGKILNLPEATSNNEPVRKIDLDTVKTNLETLQNSIGDVNSSIVEGTTVKDKLDTVQNQLGSIAEGTTDDINGATVQDKFKTVNRFFANILKNTIFEQYVTAKKGFRCNRLELGYELSASSGQYVVITPDDNTGKKLKFGDDSKRFIEIHFNQTRITGVNPPTELSGVATFESSYNTAMFVRRSLPKDFAIYYDTTVMPTENKLPIYNKYGQKIEDVVFNFNTYSRPEDNDYLIRIDNATTNGSITAVSNSTVIESASADCLSIHFLFRLPTKTYSGNYANWFPVIKGTSNTGFVGASRNGMNFNYGTGSVQVELIGAEIGTTKDFQLDTVYAMLIEYKQDKARFYINGELQFESNYNSSSSFADCKKSLRYCFGADSYSKRYMFDLGSLCVLNRELTDKEKKNGLKFTGLDIFNS